MQKNFTASELSLSEYKLLLDSMTVYRGILDDKLVRKLHNLLNYTNNEYNSIEKVISLYSDFCFTLIRSGFYSFKEYIIQSILLDENSFSYIAQVQRYEDITPLLKNAVGNDLRKLQLLCEISPTKLKEFAKSLLNSSKFEIHVIENLAEWEVASEKPDPGRAGFEVRSAEWEKSTFTRMLKVFYSSADWGGCVEALVKFHNSLGCGIFARYRAFVWEASGNSCRFKGIDSMDPIKLSQLIGYEVERAEVIENTIQFLKGSPANNVLLYGDRGTGKSSTVKAILNEYFESGLRIIEVPKALLIDFPKIVKNLKNRNQKFIIFVDDLAFEDNEDSYTALKAVLEGGLENKPGNVLVYATSNRRHLIKEKFSDRFGLQSHNKDEEVHAYDTIQEKLSLADRFGITVVFSSPDKERYLKIVEGIAENRGLKVDKEYLHSEALKWELWYNGRSPRTARQFVDWLEGSVKDKEQK